ncbi:MAG: MlaE family lipid ABC transporter permease subunit [Candidatus Cloacimonetes bacterium]|nr:MlaE family lipid ABC transporter permease subunit [Candidatus Cloacimonadota bacterium]
MNYSDKKLFLQGALTKSTVPVLSGQVHEFLGREIRFIDLNEVTAIDSAGVAFLDDLQERLQQYRPRVVNLSPAVRDTIKVFTRRVGPEIKAVQPENVLVKIGSGLLLWKDSVVRSFILAADIIFWSIIGIFDRKGQRKGSVISQSILIGVDALGIIGLLSLILGLILALQSAAQLRQFGANIYVADLIAISMVREMGPMMTAILVAGRSGSAIASEIATMKVTEEIDALRMMAIDPIRYVVVPKFHAITICMPLLVTVSTLVGIVGGLIIGITYLDLSPVSYFNEAFNILTFKDVIIGLMKSLFFAWVIVIIGSYYGLSVKGGAEGVGKVTTLAVVASIFWVIVLDAINSLIFYF